MSLPLNEAAARVVADLMPIAIVVADAGGGQGAADFAGALGEAGAGAEIYAASGEGGYDLAVLLADPDPGRHAGVGTLIEGLAAVSDRLLFVPSAAAAGGEAPDLNGWFELFAEQGYQPVVDYDAGFLGQGAFLVDRNATAAETELSAFADRLSMGGALAASTQRVAVLEAALGTEGDREAARAELVARRADLDAATLREAALQARAAAAESALADARVQLAGWQSVAKALGAWVHHACAAPGRDTLAALRAVSGFAPKKRFLARLRPRRRAVPSAVEQALLADAALVRASALFDAGWYIASHPALAESGGDPVLHYVAKGAAAGADPGPYFDSAAYRAAHPGCMGAPLAHAIRHGHVEKPRVS
jgi:hypothetical protein